MSYKKGRPVYYVSQVVTYSESNGRVFSGISNDLERLKAYVAKRVGWELDLGLNNPTAKDMVIEKWR